MQQLTAHALRLEWDPLMSASSSDGQSAATDSRPVVPTAALPGNAAAPAPLAATQFVPAHQMQYVGNIRSTGLCMVLYLVTLGVYSWFWMFKVHQEMKDHTHRGIGGPAAVIMWFIPVVSFFVPFITSGAVGDLFRTRSMRTPVSGATGCWLFLPLVGAFVWFIKTNGALNAYWRSQGAAA